MEKKRFKTHKFVGRIIRIKGKGRDGTQVLCGITELICQESPCFQTWRTSGRKFVLSLKIQRVTHVKKTCLISSHLQSSSLSFFFFDFSILNVFGCFLFNHSTHPLTFRLSLLRYQSRRNNWLLFPSISYSTAQVPFWFDKKKTLKKKCLLASQSKRISIVPHNSLPSLEIRNLTSWKKIDIYLFFSSQSNIFFSVTDWRAYIYSVGTECCSSSVFFSRLLGRREKKRNVLRGWLWFWPSGNRFQSWLVRPIRSGATYCIIVVVSVSLDRLIDFHFAASQQFFLSFLFHQRRNVFRCREEKSCSPAYRLFGTKRLFTRPHF